MSQPPEQRTSRGGALWRWTRRLILLAIVLAAVSRVVVPWILPGLLDGAASLGQVLAGLPDAERCVTEKMLQYTFGAKDDVDGSCLHHDVVSDFTSQSDGSLRALLTQIAIHPEFRQLPASGL